MELKDDQTAEGSSKPNKSKSAIEWRIATIRQNETTQPSSTINSESSSHKKRKKLPMTRLVNISKSLIAKNNEND